MEYEYVELFVVLTILLLIVFLISERRKSKACKIENANFHQLQTKYLTVFALANFSNWIQGAYLYEIYSSYKYEDSDIAVIYISGFMSSGMFGWIIGNIADHFGRKKMCILYNVFYMCSCYLHSYSSFEVLVIARVFGGLSSSILYSSFESWYIYEHCSRNNFPKTYLNDTFAKSTFINGVTAVLAGLIGNFIIDYLKFKYIFIFYFAMVILLINVVITALWWSETNVNTTLSHGICNMNALKFILLGRNNSKLILIGFIQLLYETAMYNFIFLWTPILRWNSRNTPFGLVFSLFMISIMLGSTVYSIFSLKNFKAVTILSISCTVAFYSFCLAIFFQNHVLVLFIMFEFSVGLYFPCMSYIRSILIPEPIRNAVTNWYRLPINVLTAFHLLLIRNENLDFQLVFGLLSTLMICAVGLSLRLRQTGLSRAILPAPINS